MSSQLQVSRFLFFFIITFLSSSCLAETHQKKCRALVLQGGGDKGAYEAGVLFGFVANTNPEEETFQYDVVTGVSVGAINGLCFSQYEKGRENEAVNDLVNFWSNVKKREIYKPWRGGFIEGLFFRPSLYNNDPEHEYLTNRVRGIPNKRKATILATDANTAERVAFTEDHWGNNTPKAIDAIMYSSAVPFVFKYRNSGSRTYVDGGWSGEGLDIEDAILRCKEVVDDEKDIIVDIIYANHIGDIDVKSQNYTTLQMLSRYQSIKDYVASTKAFTFAETFYPDVTFRYVIQASKRLPNQDVPLSFNEKDLRFMIELGQEDALKAMEEGPGKGAERLRRIARNF